MSKIRSVLFVCTGNSCRSVMAEGLMKKRLKELGKDHIKVFSAGTGAMDGFAPTDETIEVMKMENIDVSGYRSKHITEYIIKNSDLILVMEEAHKTLISEIAPEARSKTYLLKEYGAGAFGSYPENSGIPDPIGRPLDFYNLSFEVIRDQIDRIAQLI